MSLDDSLSTNAIVDRDTYGLPGSPSIVDSITAKIAKSDFFVCDISIINPNANSRPTPNPNVLYELGFASAILGWDRIITVQNVAFGGIEKLPFDLRGRRVIQYNVDETVEGKTGQKAELKTNLSKIFIDAFKYYVENYFATDEKIIWWGIWELSNKVKARGGNLFISRVSSDAFYFRLNLYDGARLGEVVGRAKIITPHSAYARIKTPLDETCEITFRRRLVGNTWHIDIETESHVAAFMGRVQLLKALTYTDQNL